MCAADVLQNQGFRPELRPISQPSDLLLLDLYGFRMQFLCKPRGADTNFLRWRRPADRAARPSLQPETQALACMKLAHPLQAD